MKKEGVGTSQVCTNQDKHLRNKTWYQIIKEERTHRVTKVITSKYSSNFRSLSSRNLGRTSLPESTRTDKRKVYLKL